MSKITTLRTIRILERPNLIWLEIDTDESLTGLGETFRGAVAVEAAIHELIAPQILGQDARHIEGISRKLLKPYIGFHSASAEVRAASAVEFSKNTLSSDMPWISNSGSWIFTASISALDVAYAFASFTGSPI